MRKINDADPWLDRFAGACQGAATAAAALKLVESLVVPGFESTAATGVMADLRRLSASLHAEVARLAREAPGG